MIHCELRISMLLQLIKMQAAWKQMRLLQIKEMKWQTWQMTTLQPISDSWNLRLRYNCCIYLQTEGVGVRWLLWNKFPWQPNLALNCNQAISACMTSLVDKIEAYLKPQNSMSHIHPKVLTRRVQELNTWRLCNVMAFHYFSSEFIVLHRIDRGTMG